MFAIWKSIPVLVRIIGITLLVLIVIAAYQWGYINGAKSNKP